jgi:MFS superfamily sulfate permease-like transporter
MFKPFLEVTTLDESTVQIVARGSAVFTNWIPFRRQIVQLGLEQGNNLIVNLEGTRLVDHSAMEGLQQLQEEFERAGLTLDVVGLDEHRPLSGHPLATRRRRQPI